MLAESTYAYPGMNKVFFFIPSFLIFELRVETFTPKKLRRPRQRLPIFFHYISPEQQQCDPFHFLQSFSLVDCYLCRPSCFLKLWEEIYR